MFPLKAATAAAVAHDYKIFLLQGVYMFSTVCRSACHATSLGLRSLTLRKLPSSLAHLFHQRRSLASFIPAQECMSRTLQVIQEKKQEKAREEEAMRSFLKHRHADKVRKAEEKIQRHGKNHGCVYHMICYQHTICS